MVKNQNMMGYMNVHCAIYSQDRDNASDSMELIPVHSRNGFYYGGNMHMPDHMGEGHHHDDDSRHHR
ncbi:MAG: hypothetical protein ABIA63_08655 [bacterium]